jgi:hypothetical protein
MTNGRVCVHVAADSNPEVAKHDLCVSAAMRAIADTSMRQCIFLLMSISQNVLALHLIMLLCS